MGCTCSIASPATGELTEANLHRLHRYYVSTNLQLQTSSPLSALSEDDSDGAACYRSQRCKAEPVTPPLTPAASKVSSNRSRGAPPSYVSMTEDWVASVEHPSAVPGVDELDWSPHMTTVASYEADVTGPTQLDDC